MFKRRTESAKQVAVAFVERRRMVVEVFIALSNGPLSGTIERGDPWHEGSADRTSAVG